MFLVLLIEVLLRRGDWIVFFIVNLVDFLLVVLLIFINVKFLKLRAFFKLEKLILILLGLVMIVEILFIVLIKILLIFL